MLAAASTGRLGAEQAAVWAPRSGRAVAPRCGKPARLAAGKPKQGEVVTGMSFNPFEEVSGTARRPGGRRKRVSQACRVLWLVPPPVACLRLPAQTLPHFSDSALVRHASLISLPPAAGCARARQHTRRHHRSHHLVCAHAHVWGALRGGDQRSDQHRVSGAGAMEEGQRKEAGSRVCAPRDCALPPPPPPPHPPPTPFLQVQLVVRLPPDERLL